MEFLNKRVKLGPLIATAGFLGITVGVTALLLEKEKEDLKNLPDCLKKAVKLVQSKPAVVELIGEPITVAGVPTVKKDKIENKRLKEVTVSLPIKGPNDSALLHVNAVRKSEYQKLKLHRLEMTFGKIKNKKLILFDADVPDNPFEAIKLESQINKVIKPEGK